MTDQEWQDLGRRAIACKHWRWVPGMAWTIPHRARKCWPARLHSGRYPIPDGLAPIPDFRDAATGGCLLALVREAWADAGASVWRDHRTGLWCWMAQGAFHSVHCPGVDGYDTEAESLVAALEAAP